MLIGLTKSYDASEPSKSSAASAIHASSFFVPHPVRIRIHLLKTHGAMNMFFRSARNANNR